jgi:hypothetical protein
MAGDTRWNVEREHSCMNHPATPEERRSNGIISRRSAIAAFVLIGAAPLTAAAQQSDSATPAAATPVADATDQPLGEATMPQWRFTVLEMIDPYGGTLTKPDGLPANTRVVALQVILANESDQPLEFMVTDFRLRDTDGAEYRAGDYLGTEPRIVSQNLPDGERTRGWVWFGIPEATQVSSLVFIAPPPILRVPLS